MKKSSQIPSFGQGLELTNVVSKAIASAVKTHDVSSGEIQKVIGRPGQVFKYFDKLFAPDKVDKKIGCLELIATPETLILEALDGEATIASALRTRLDNKFKNWGLDNKSEASEKTPIQVYEMVKDANYFQMFGSLNNDLDKLCLTQNQIVRFREKYPNHLKQDGSSTFFLFKEDEEYFVAYIYADSNGLLADVERFGVNSIWGSAYSHRVIVPQ